MKNYITKILSIVFISLFQVFNSQATHMVGGEIKYECLGGNNYRFTISLYQSCLSGTEAARDFDFQPFIYTVFEHSPGMPRVVLGKTLDHTIDFIPHGFSSECISNLPPLCLQKGEVIVDLNLPPSDYGYTIAYQRCCRNEGIMNLIGSGNVGVTYSIYIPPFEDGECANNSAYFSELPPQIICKDFPFMYSYAAIDPDGDSLVYRLCESYLGATMDNPKPEPEFVSPPPYTSAPYNGILNATNPIPGLPPATIDPVTGLFTVTPTSTGRYQVKVCVDEYRNGELISTQSRDVQYIITECKKNIFADIPIRSSEPNTFRTICDGYTVQFENTSVGGSTFTWDFGDGSPLVEGFEPIHTYSDTGTYEVKLILDRGLQCTDSILRLVKVYPYFLADFSINGDRCPGKPIQFIDSFYFTGNNTLDSFYWDFGDGNFSNEHNPIHTYDTGNIYKVRLYGKSRYGCEIWVEKDIDIRNFVPSAGNDTIIVLGYDYYLNASGGDYYRWSPSDYLSDPNIANPKVNFVDTGYYTYVVNVTAEEGCGGLDTINILVVENPSILLPNAFSPNGDGLNDVFKPKIIGYPFINYLSVYNRFGERVFITYNPNQGWDGTYNGKIADLGVYFYEISVMNLEGQSVIQKGDVTLIR